MRLARHVLIGVLTIMHIESYSDSQLQGPLEILILKQLDELIVGEKQLAKRYEKLRDAADQRESSRFETEVLKLNQRADRLHRMIEAMSCGAGSAFCYDSDPVAA